MSIHPVSSSAVAAQVAMVKMINSKVIGSWRAKILSTGTDSPPPQNHPMIKNPSTATASGIKISSGKNCPSSTVSSSGAKICGAGKRKSLPMYGPTSAQATNKSAPHQVPDSSSATVVETLNREVISGSDKETMSRRRY